MNATLASQLWKSPAVRVALKKEALRLFAALAVGLGIAVYIRYFTGSIPSREGLLSIVVGVVAIVVLWLVSLVRTLRSVLREHSLLE
jgi:uncharacterized membrane protein